MDNLRKRIIRLEHIIAKLPFASDTDFIPKPKDSENRNKEKMCKLCKLIDKNINLDNVNIEYLYDALEDAENINDHYFTNIDDMVDRVEDSILDRK